jgi:RNA-directed DNA polymerase
MTDTSTNRLLLAIVLERIAAGEMFTAFDVTTEARKRGANVRHGEARDIIHGFWEAGTMGAAYSRTTIDVGAPTRPFLYHRYDADPSSYPGIKSKPSAANTIASPVAPQTGSNDPPKRASLLGRVVDRLLGRSTPTSTGNASGGSASKHSSQVPQVVRKPSSYSGLDTSPFLPIDRKDLFAKASKLQPRFSIWFGRRDLIPPTSDPRTNLIDRGMVSNGILTPEELAEIHSVGDEMSRHQPEQIRIAHEANRAADAKIEEDKDAKRKLREQKKAEAAAKRERHKDQVRERRLSTIDFLGRRVSSRLNDCVSNVAKLEQLGLPVMSEPKDLATQLQLTIPQLRWLAYHNEVANRTHYIQFQVKKRSGGMRTLHAPHRKLAHCQTWILRNILDKLPVETSAHGFVQGRSIATNARLHVGKQVVLNMDLEDFFPSIHFPRVRSFFQRIGYSPCVATILALLCTEAPREQTQWKSETYWVATGPRGLPQGAPTSPALSNHISQKLDRRLAGLASKLDCVYSRYADDITFSGNESLSQRIGYVLARVKNIARDEGFQVKDSKSRVLKRNQAQSVTGIVVNDVASVPRTEIRRIRAILHRARREGLSAQNRDGHPDFLAWLRGMIAYIHSVRPEVAVSFKADLEELLKP